MGPNQNYKLFHSKNHKQNERQPTGWKKIFANNAAQGIDFQNTHTAHTTQQ